jgi:hypothetical protein
MLNKGDVAYLDIASVCHTEGSGFKSRHSRKKYPKGTRCKETSCKEDTRQAKAKGKARVSRQTREKAKGKARVSRQTREKAKGKARVSRQTREKPKRKPRFLVGLAAKLVSSRVPLFCFAFSRVPQLRRNEVQAIRTEQQQNGKAAEQETEERAVRYEVARNRADK